MKDLQDPWEVKPSKCHQQGLCLSYTVYIQLMTKLVGYLMKTPVSPVCWLASPTCGKTECSWFCFHVSEQLKQKHKAEDFRLKTKADVELKVRRIAFKRLPSLLAHVSPFQGRWVDKTCHTSDTQMLRNKVNEQFMEISSPDFREGRPQCGASLVNVEYQLLLFYNMCIMSHSSPHKEWWMWAHSWCKELKMSP